MGLHNLPASYDAWRLTPPDDRPRRRNGWTPKTVTTSLLIEAGDVQIDASGTYSTSNGELLTVHINGVDMPPHEVEAMLGRFAPRQTGAWDDDLDEDTLSDLIDAAQRDAEDDHADYLRDQRMTA